MRSDNYSDSVGRNSGTSQPASPLPTSSELGITNLEDLPDDVLVEILSRLPSYEFVFKCKLVCKFWGKLMSEPNFIGRFVLQQQRLQLPLSNLMNQRVEASAFEHVVGVCNDLVLCSPNRRELQSYRVYNPYTGQKVDLPRAVRGRFPPAGIICDPIYKKARHNAHGERVCIDFNYRCKVVRLHTCEENFLCDDSSKLMVNIFSFDTGEWRESVVSFPREFRLDRIDTFSGFAHNEMLYWASTWESSGNFLIGLNPFEISDTQSDDQESSYRGRFIELGLEEDGDNLFPLYDAHHMFQIQCQGVAEGSDCLQTCVYDSTNKTHDVLVWDLSQELITRADGVEKLCLKKYIPVDIPKEAGLLTFDPRIEGVLHAKLIHCGVVRISYAQINFGSRSSEMEVDMAGKSIVDSWRCFRICDRSLWPTPVPSLPMKMAVVPKEEIKKPRTIFVREMQKLVSVLLLEASDM